MNPFINGMYQQVPQLVNTNQQQPVRMPLVPVQVVSWHIGTEQQNQLMQLAVTQSGNSQLSSQHSTSASFLTSRAAPVKSVATSASIQNVNSRAVAHTGLQSADIRAVSSTGFQNADIRAVPSTGLQSANLQPPEDFQFVIGSVFSLADTIEGSTRPQTNLPNTRNIVVSENGQSHNIRMVDVDPRHSSLNVPLLASQGSQDPPIMIRSVFSLADDVRQRDHQKTHSGSPLLSTRDGISHEQKQNQQNITTAAVSNIPLPPSYQNAVKNKVDKTQNLAPQTSSVDVLVCPSIKSGTTVSSTHLTKSDVLPTSLGTALLHSKSSNFLHTEPPNFDVLKTLLKTSPLYVNSCNNDSQLKSPPISTTVPAKFTSTSDASSTLRNCPATSTVPSTKIIAFGDAGSMHKNLTATPVELSQSKILTSAEEKHKNVRQVDDSVSQNVAKEAPKVVVVDLDNEDIDDCMLVKIDLSKYKYNYAGKIHNSKVVIDDDSDNGENLADLTNDNGSPSKSAEDHVSVENERQQNCVKSNSGLKQQPNRVEDNFLINQKQSKVSSAESSTAHQNLNSASQSVQDVNQVILHKQSYEINTEKVQNNPAEPTLSGDASSSTFEELDMQVEDETEVLSDTECSPGKLLIASELSLSGSSSPVELKTTSSLPTSTYVIPNLQANNQSSNYEVVTHGIEKEPIPNLQRNNQSSNHEAVSHSIEKEPIHIEKSQFNRPTAVVQQHSLNFHKVTAAQHSASAYNIPVEVIKVQNIFNFQTTEATTNHDKTSDKPSTSDKLPPTNNPISVNPISAVPVAYSKEVPKQASIMCKLCFQFFPSRMALATHVFNCHRMVHSGNKYQCQHCSMDFNSPSLLKLHQKCKCSSNGQRLPTTGDSEFKNILKGRTASDRTMPNQPHNMNSSINVNQLYLTTANAKSSSVNTVYQSEKEIGQNKPSKHVTGTENNDISKRQCDKPEQQGVDNGKVQVNPGQSHLLSFSSEKHIVHECDFCYKKFFSHSALENHRRFSTCSKMPVKEFTCSVCKQVYTTGTLCYFHMWSNPGCRSGIEKYCSKCSLSFKNSMEKQAHLQLSEKCWLNEIRLVESVVNKSAKSQDYDYLKQLKKAHNILTNNATQLSETAGTASTNSFHDENLQNPDLSSSKTVRCEMCKIWFSSYADLKQHFIVSAQCKAHNDKLYGQGKTDVKRVQSPPKRRGAMCPECKRRFATNEVLALHLSDSAKCRMKVIKSSRSSKKRSGLDKRKAQVVQDDYIQEVDRNANNQSKSASSVSKNGPSSVIDVCQVRESEPQRQLLIHSGNMSCNIIPTINKNLPKKKELRIILKPVSVMCKTCYLPFSNDQYLSKHLQTSTSCLICPAKSPQKEDSHSENMPQNSAYVVNNTAGTQIKPNAKLDFTLVNHDHDGVVTSGEVHANSFSTNEKNVGVESKKDSGSNVLFVIDDSSSSEDDTDSENSTSSCEEGCIEYKCKVCSKTFNSRSVFMKHVKTQCNSSPRNKSVHCKVCTRKFHDRVGLQAHLLKYKFCFIPLTRAMLEKKQEPYTCCMCKKSFESPKILRKHCFKKMTCRLRYVDLLLNNPKIQDSHEESVIGASGAQILQPIGNSSPESKRLANKGPSSTQGGENLEAETLSSSTDVIQVSSKSVTSGNTVVETEKECAGCGKKFANFLEHLFKQQSCLELYGKGRVKCPVQLPYCFNCKTPFENYDIFSNHSCDGSNSCPSCFREFSSMKGLKIHIQQVHKLESIQDAELKNKKRKQHVKDLSSTESVNPTEKSANKQPSDQLIPCRICDAKFPNLRLLMEHSYEHVEDISLTCERCNITFHHYNRFVSHQAYHIRMDKEASDEIEEQQQPRSECFLEERSLSSPSSSSNDKASSVCVFCLQDFLSKSSKIDHIYKNPACKASMRHTVDSMFLKKDLTETKTFGETTTQLDRCEFCLQKFSDRISHYLSSSCLESLEEAVVKYRSNLNHIEYKNEGITSEVRESAATQHSSQSSNRIYCKFDNCNVSFGKKSSYHRHLRKHTGPQQSHAKISDSESWYCVRCNITLKTLPEAKHHSTRCKHNQLLPLDLMEHVDWNYLRCKICNITYVKKVGLVKHMQSKHCNGKSKLPQANVSSSVLCTICNDYIVQSQTKEHLLQHKLDFNKMARERALLKGSLVRFVCFICDRAFSYGSDLARHIASHSYSHIFVSGPEVAKDDKSEEESSGDEEHTSEDSEQITVEEQPSELVPEMQSKPHTTVHKIGNFHSIGSCRLCHKKFSNFVAFRFHFKNSHKKYGSVNYEHYLMRVKESEVKMDPERTGGSSCSVFFKPGRFSEKSPPKTFVTGTYNKQNQEEQHADKIQTTHKKIDVKRICQICQESFTKISLYQAHLRIHLKKCVVVVSDCSQLQAKPIVHYSPTIRNGQSSLKVKIRVDNDSVHKILYLQEEMIHFDSVASEDDTFLEAEESDHATSVVCASESDKLGDETESEVFSQNVDIFEQAGDGSISENTMSMSKTDVPNSETSVESDSTLEIDADECISKITCNEGNACSTEDAHSSSGNGHVSNKSGAEFAGDGSVAENAMSMSKMDVPNSETSVESDSTLEIDTDECISKITCNEGNVCSTEDTHSGSGNGYVSNKSGDDFAEVVQLHNEESYNGCKESDLRDNDLNVNTLPEDLKKNDAGEDNQDQYNRETVNNTYQASEISTFQPDQTVQNTNAECRKRKIDEEDNPSKKLKVTD